MSPQASKFSQVIAFSKKYPLSRGMASYAIIWPLGSLMQQIIAKEEQYDLTKVARYSFYGSCYVAPTIYYWIKIANTIWPLSNLKSALTKAIIEQFTYTPFAMVSFYFGMSLLEGKTVEDGMNEVKAKFFPTYQVGACVWPILQTFNYTVIKERNRVVFVSICSLMWTSFLAYMKHLESEQVSSGLLKIVEADPSKSEPPLKPVHHIASETKRNNWSTSQQLDR